jgi:hypothetical protein
MTSLKTLSLLLALLFQSSFTWAFNEDKNIVIEDKNQTFRFEKNKSGEVVIKENYTVKYRCKEVRDVITFVEMYNDKQTIDNVDVYVNNKKDKYAFPKYEYYSIRDIFYSDARICYFNLQFDKKDAACEVRLDKTHKDPRYFSAEYFTEEYFTEKKTVTFVVPKWMNCEIKENNFSSAIIKTVTYDKKEDADIYTYALTNVPAFESEPMSPGQSYIYPFVLVICKEAITDAGKITYFNSVADLYKWCSGIVKDLGDDNVILTEKAKEITAGLTDDVAKVSAILNWVHRNIRYIAFEDGIAAFKPAKAQDVLNKNYGDCKGMANLILGLLKSLGYDARLCWIGTNHIAYDLATPVLSVHNHMICAWKYKGKLYYLDGTETNIGFNEYAERIAGRQVLVENGADYLLEHVPSASPEQNPEKEKRVIMIEKDVVKGTSEHIFKGEARSSILYQIQSTKKDNLQQSLINYLSENNQDYKIVNLKTTELLGVDSILKISYDIEYKNGVSSFGNEMYTEIDFRKEFDNFIIDTAKRKHDLMLSYKMNVDHETDITIPTGYSVTTLPADLKLHHSNIDINITYKQDGNKIIYRKQIKIPTVMLKKSDFNNWNDVIKQLTEKYKEQIVFTKK